MKEYSSQVIKKINESIDELIENEMISKSVFDLEAIIRELNETRDKYKLSIVAEHVLVKATAEYEYRLERLSKVGIKAGA